MADTQMNLKNLYEHHYKKLLVLPAVLVLIAVIIIGVQYNTTGDILNRDVSLKGGITATVETTQKLDLDMLEKQLTTIFGDVGIRRLAEFGTDSQIGIIVEIGETKEAELKSALEEALNLKLTENNYSTEIVGSSLGESFYKQLLVAMMFAFLFMGIVIFVAYRTFIPSITVISAAFFDIICTIAVIDLIGLKVSTAGIAGILLLIGYSVDSDALLTTKVIKRKEGLLIERVLESMKTTFTMTVATIAAVVAGFLVSSSTVLQEMFTIILVGLVIDLIMTYAMNAPILIMYVKKKESAGAVVK